MEPQSIELTGYERRVIRLVMSQDSSREMVAYLSQHFGVEPRRVREVWGEG